MRTIAAAVIVLVAIAACGGSNPEAAAASDVCTYFAPTPLSAGVGGMITGLAEGASLASGDQANATPALWAMAQAWESDVSASTSANANGDTDQSTAYANDGAKQVTAIQAWCSAHGYASASP
jgi:hypothetical protein